MNAYIYMISNKKDGTLYIGVTNNLVKRVYEHKSGFIDSFTKRYNLVKLVYFEMYDDIVVAIKREKTLKKWRREWKISLEDLYEGLL